MSGYVAGKQTLKALTGYVMHWEQPGLPFSGSELRIYYQLLIQIIMTIQNYQENEPLDIGSPEPDQSQWFKVEGRFGERIHPIGPKYTTGYVKTFSIHHAKESYLAYFGKYFASVEVLRITPVGFTMPMSEIFPAKRN